MNKFKNKKGRLVKEFEDSKQIHSSKVIGLFGFFALTGAAIMNIVFVPSFASSGFNSILWLLIGGLLWFIPVALCAAEMATVKQWSQRGGLYNWSMMMLGKRWGWTAIFFQWFQITIVSFVLLDFSVTGMFYMAGQDNFFQLTWFTERGITGAAAQSGLLDHEAIKWAIMLLILAVLISLNMFGIKFSEWFSRFGLPLGVILPALLIIIFGFWSFSTHAGHVSLQTPIDGGRAIIPSFTSDAFSNVSQLVIFSTFITSYTGIEQSASTIRRMKKPGRDYPIAVLLVAAILIILSILTTVAIVITIPNVTNSNIFGLSDGIYYTFQQLIVGGQANSGIFGINANEATAVFKFACFLALMGGLNQFNAVVIEPSTGMHGAFVNMRFPEGLTKINRFKVHYNILFLQSGIMIFWFTILNFVAAAGSNANNLTFTISVNLAVTTYCFSYVLLFVSYLKLNLSSKYRNLERKFAGKLGRAFKIPFAFIALLLTLFAMSITFAPPGDIVVNGVVDQQALTQYLTNYLPVMIVLYLFVVSIPFVTYQINFVRLYKKSIYNFLHAKSFPDTDIKKLWRAYKKDRYNLKMSGLLSDLGMDANFINYYHEIDVNAED